MPLVVVDQRGASQMPAPAARSSIAESIAGVVVVVAKSVVVVSNRVELVVLVLPLEPHGQLSVIA